MAQAGAAVTATTDDPVGRAALEEAAATVLAVDPAWPETPTVHDLLGLSPIAGDALLSPALGGRLGDLRAGSTTARDQVGWCMARCGFNADWVAREATVGQDRVLLELARLGVPRDTPYPLHSVAVVWAHLVLADPDGRADRLRLLRTAGSSGPPAVADARHPAAPDPVPSRRSRYARVRMELMGGVDYRHTRPNSWRELLPRPPAPPPRPGGPDIRAARELLGVSALASAGVVTAVRDALLGHLGADA